MASSTSQSGNQHYTRCRRVKDNEIATLKMTESLSKMRQSMLLIAGDVERNPGPKPRNHPKARSQTKCQTNAQSQTQSRMKTRSQGKTHSQAKVKQVVRNVQSSTSGDKSQLSKDHTTPPIEKTMQPPDQLPNPNSVNIRYLDGRISRTFAMSKLCTSQRNLNGSQKDRNEPNDSREEEHTDNKHT